MEIPVDILATTEAETIQVYRQSIDSPSIEDADFHLRLVALCEQAGDTENAIRELNLAIRDGCREPHILAKLGDYDYDLGRIRSAARCYEQVLLVNSTDTTTAQKLGNIYEELDELGKTKELYQALYKRTGLEFYTNLLKNIDVQYFKPSLKIKTQKPGVSLSDDLLLKFVDLFSGREDHYARQWVNEKGETGYVPVREHFSPQIARNHLIGNHTIGIYQLRLNSTVNWAAFDIDISKRYRQSIERGDISEKTMLNQAWRMVLFIQANLQKFGIPSYIEFSGLKGYHIWFFFETPMPAAQVRVFLLNVVKMIATVPEGIEVEIFPKQNRLPANGMGNLIKLPLGIHRKSNQYSYFVDLERNSVENQHRYLMMMQKIPRERFFEIETSCRFSEHFVDQGQDWEQIVSNKETERDAPLYTQAHPFDPYAVPEFDFMKLKCEVIAFLINKIVQTRTLSSDEKVVLKFTLGHLDAGVELVNHFLMMLPETKEVDLLKSKLNGNPISCNKIRKRLNQATQFLNCACNFTHLSSYPYPALHLEELKNAKLKDTDNSSALVRFHASIQYYIRLKEEIRQRQLTMSELEKFLHAYFEEKDITEINTPVGIIERVKRDENRYELILRI